MTFVPRLGSEAGVASRLQAPVDMRPESALKRRRRSMERRVVWHSIRSGNGVILPLRCEDIGMRRLKVLWNH